MPSRRTERLPHGDSRCGGDLRSDDQTDHALPALEQQAQQAAILLHSTRGYLVRQRTRIANVRRACAAELGLVVATCLPNAPKLLSCMGDDESLPDAVRPPVRFLAERFRALDASLAEVAGAISEAHKADESNGRLASIPSAGIVTGSLASAPKPDVANFRSAHDCAAWLGLTPKPVKLVAIVLANRMARVIWALLRTGEVFGSLA